MDILITGLAKRDFNGFSIKTKSKNVKLDTPVGIVDPISGRRKTIHHKKMIKEIKITIYLSDGEFVDFKKDLEKSIIKIS